MQMRDTASPRDRLRLGFGTIRALRVKNGGFGPQSGEQVADLPRQPDAEAPLALLKSTVFPMCRPTFPPLPRRVMALFD